MTQQTKTKGELHGARAPDASNYKQIDLVYFSYFQPERIIKIKDYLKKPMGWLAVYKDNKGYFCFERSIRAYFKLEEDIKKIEELSK